MHVEGFSSHGDTPGTFLHPFGFKGPSLLKTAHLRQIAVGPDVSQFQAMGLGVHASAHGASEPPMVPPEKTKKVVPLPKQLTNKISSSSSKLTELMAWEAKVADNKVLFLIL